MIKRKAYKPVTITSTVGVQFILLPGLMAESSSPAPYLVSRYAVHNSLNYPDVYPGLKYSIGLGPGAFYDAAVKIASDKVSLGCQVFVGKDLTKLRKWAMGD